MLGRLQVLRAVAAYMVVAYHCFECLHGNGFGVPTIPVGAAGVDLFFVISGFIMVYIARPNDTPVSFMVNRIGRIAPLYWLVTLAVVAAVLVRPWFFPAALLGWDTLLASLTFFPMMGGGGSFTPLLSVGWTLNLEMAFYVLFALSMLAPSRYRIPVLIALMTALFAAGLAAPANSFASFYGNTILYEFAAGCLIGQAVRVPSIHVYLKRIPALWLVIAGTVLLLFSGSALENLVLRPITWGIPAVLIVLGVVLLDMTQAPTTNRFLASLGDASYSAYLLHPFVIVLGTFTIIPMLGVSLLSAATFMCTVFCLTMLASTLSYRFIEVPARNLLRRFTHSSKRKPGSKAPLRADVAHR